MFLFTSIKGKLGSISALTILGYAILIIFILLFANSLDKYGKTKQIIQTIQLGIHELDKINQDHEKQFETIEKNLHALKIKLQEIDIDSNAVQTIMTQLQESKKAYDAVKVKQNHINKNLQLMDEAKTELNELFAKVYDYKLMHYMMKLHLHEKEFLLNKKFDEKEFEVDHFKMRRSVRGSEHFTEDKVIQQKINGALIKYKEMLLSVVSLNKEIGFSNNDGLKSILNKNILTISKSSDNMIKEINTTITNKRTTTIYTMILLAIFIVIIEFGLVHYLSRQIDKNLKKVQKGLMEFFDFISQKTDHVEMIEIESKDEFKIMADHINENIEKNIFLLNHNREVLEEANDILQKVSNGFYGYKIPHHNNVSPDVKELIINVNKMLDETKSKFDILQNALTAYGQYNFDYTIPKKSEEGLYGDFGSLVASTKLIGNNVAEFLAMIINTGDKLNLDTTTLSQSSNQLSSASNSQATSLEETAAALEEITTNIEQNMQHVFEMGTNAKELSKTSSEGLQLASKTANSMDEINSQVVSISEAIGVIDQIAFQTNILSLNAAVEAATAGEAGKGFAVVAQEVRNLASRSAEAAKEIKDLVEKATSKTIEGKSIADNMSKGYEALSVKVNDTLKIIESVSSASTQQRQGIVQINDAITVLDQNTQINAQNAQNIAQLATTISNLSEDLISAASQGKFNPIIRKQVCDVDLVYQTSKLKNDHINFKMQNFQKLGTYQKWTVKNEKECDMGHWISEYEANNHPITQSKEWEELKKIHHAIHFKVQEYIDKNAQRVDNLTLRQIAAQIESNTLMLFDKLNQLKVNNCKQVA